MPKLSLEDRLIISECLDSLDKIAAIFYSIDDHMAGKQMQDARDTLNFNFKYYLKEENN